MITWSDLFNSQKATVCRKRVLAFDPGETTGWAKFSAGQFRACGQLDTKENKQLAFTLMETIGEDETDIVIIENFVLYPWKRKTLTFDSMWTSQVIGYIKCLCDLENIPYVVQTASAAKGFCTDEKVGQWLQDWNKVEELKGNRHAKDAIRHGAYYVLFSGEKNE